MVCCSLLFAGLLINRDSTAKAITWLHSLSFFHAAYEALAVNELRYLQLKEIKVGLTLCVPGEPFRSHVAFPLAVRGGAGCTRSNHPLHIRLPSSGENLPSIMCRSHI